MYEVITIKTSTDRSWPLFKLVDKYGEGTDYIHIYEDKGEVEVRFRVKKVLFSRKFGRFIFLKKAYKAVC